MGLHGDQGEHQAGQAFPGDGGAGAVGGQGQEGEMKGNNSNFYFYFSFVIFFLVWKRPGQQAFVCFQSFKA